MLVINRIRVFSSYRIWFFLDYPAVPGISATKLNVIISNSDNLIIVTLLQKTQLLLCKHGILLSILILLFNFLSLIGFQIDINNNAMCCDIRFPIRIMFASPLIYSLVFDLPLIIRMLLVKAFV